MPTQREYDNDNPEIKSDPRPSHRLRFLDTASGLYQYPLAWLTPTGCFMCTATRYVFTLLAMYGLYSLLT